MRITRVAISTVVILLAASSLFAQDKKQIPRGEMNKYVVSAKAGVVNVIEGDAQVVRARPFAIAEMLLSGDELQGGDIVMTGAGGRAEILLNPGSYLRLGEKSEIVFLFGDLANDKIKLLRGSAVLEASALEGLLVVETPKATFAIARDGLYRFNVDADGKAEVAVRKGRLVVDGTNIKQGKHAIVEGGTAAIAKLDKKDTDSLDAWSKERAKTLIALNGGLSRAGVNRTLGMSFMRNAWIYDPFCRCYTFLPFAGGFASPYGWDYLVCNPYGYYYSRPRYNNGGWIGGGGGSGSQGGGRNSGGGGSTGGGGSIGGGGGGSHSSPPPISTGGGGPSRGADRETPAPRRP